MAKFLLIALFLLTQSAQAATVVLCATHDDYDKYFVADITSRAAVQKQVIALCIGHRKARSACNRNLICNTLNNRKPTRFKKIIPFPARMRGPQPTPRPSRPAPSEPSRPSEPSSPPRNTNPGGNCRANSDCYSTQYCAGGQCFERTGNGSQSCKSNNDCYSNDFCVGGQCFPKSGRQGGSCKVNNDCYSYQFCVSGACFDKQ